MALLLLYAYWRAVVVPAMGDVPPQSGDIGRRCMGRWSRQHVIWLVWLVGAIGLSGWLVLAGLTASEARAVSEPAPAHPAADQILGQPRHLLYHSVTVDGEIARVWNSRTFALRSRSTRCGLLVVLGDQAARPALPLQQGQQVTVTGTVRPLSRQDMEILESWAAAPSEQLVLQATYAYHPYVLAQEVRIR